MAAKWLKTDTLFMTKMAENHTLWGRTYLYSPYKEVPPGGRLLPASLKLCRSTVIVKIKQVF